eukprot:g31418.t1
MDLSVVFHLIEPQIAGVCVSAAGRVRITSWKPSRNEPRWWKRKLAAPPKDEARKKRSGRKTQETFKMLRAGGQ